jgi:hypothetical protein
VRDPDPELRQWVKGVLEKMATRTSERRSFQIDDEGRRQ